MVVDALPVAAAAAKEGEWRQANRVDKARKVPTFRALFVADAARGSLDGTCRGAVHRGHQIKSFPNVQQRCGFGCQVRRQRINFGDDVLDLLT